MILRTYLNQKCQYLSKNIEHSVSKLFDITLNIFNFDPADFEFQEYNDIKNIPKYAVSRECIWEFANNSTDNKDSFIRKISKKLHKNLVIYFGLDMDEMILNPVLANNKSLKNCLRLEHSTMMKYQQGNSIIKNIISFETVIIEINNRLYQKIKNTFKKSIKGFNNIEKKIFSSIKCISQYFLSYKRNQNNEVFDKGYFEEKSHYY